MDPSKQNSGCILVTQTFIQVNFKCCFTYTFAACIRATVGVYIVNILFNLSCHQNRKQKSNIIFHYE